MIEIRFNIEGHKKRSTGFTLIELLVVISIIGLLSVIVLSSLTDARTRAKNTKLNNIALEYITAFNLLTDGGTKDFPPSESLVCLGYVDGEKCSPAPITGSTAIKNMLTTYYPAMPKNEDFKVFTVSGVLYINNPPDNPKQLEWYLSGNFSCPRGAGKVYDIQDDFTTCRYSFN